MASSNGKESSKITASVDSLKLSSKNTSICSSKHPSSDSIMSKKDRECLQMQECKKKLLSGQDPPIIIRDENVILRSPPVKKITMAPPPITVDDIIIRDDNNVALKSPPVKKITAAPPLPPIDDELAAATPAQRNWRGILIALLVIAAVLGLIVFSIALLTPASDGARVRGRRPTRQDVLTAKFRVPPFNGTWISDNELVYRDRWGGLVVFNADNFTTRHLMSNSTFRELNAVDFKVSPDLRFVLLLSDVRRGWRYARLASYHVYDVLTRNKFPLSPVEEERNAPLLQYAEWSPAGSSVVFVHDNDIYYKPRVLKPLVCRITSTGVPGVIFNGVPDFLYETEVLQLERALWFSPDGQQLLFVSYNDSQVGEYQYPWYGLDDPEPPAYPSIKSIRYPKVNTKNPVATVYTVSLKTPKFLFPHAIQLTSQVDTDWYIRWSSWVSERQVALLLLNRPQNVSIISVCNAMSYNCQDVVRDESGSNRWSGLGGDPPGDDCGWCGGAPVLGAGKTNGLLTTAPLSEDETGSWRHVAHVTPAARTHLTQGPFEITQLLAWDDKRQLVYVMATPVGQAGERHLYSIHVQTADGGVWPEPPHCLTCPDSPPVAASQPPPEDPITSVEEEEYDNTTTVDPAAGWTPSPLAAVEQRFVLGENETLPNNCLYNRITFSKNFSYYVQECLGPEAPSTYLCAASGQRIRILSDGAVVRARVRALAQPQPRDFRVEVRAGRAARVRLLLPPGLRDTDDLPLPLVLHVDGAPGSQLVSEKFQVDWGWYLASTRNFIVAQIDARGSGFQGEDLRTEIYHKLLSVDVEDQIAVLSYLRDNLKMVDGARVGVWGRGYGGACAAMLAAEDAHNVTRCVASIAPITDFTQHNSYWTERYLGWGARWRGAYEAGGVTRRAGNLPGRRLLLAHAAADTRVHATHAHALAHALVKAQAMYTHQVYPDENHEFENSKMHLFRQMEEFFDDCFGPVDLGDWDVNNGGFFGFRE